MAKKEKKPASPTYSPLELPSYQSVDYAGQAAAMLPILSQYADANIGKQVKAQGDLTRNAFTLTQEIAPKAAELRVGLNEQYQPVLTQQYMDRIDQSDPTFRAVRDRLGSRVASDLDAGYGLGTELTREIEQGVRGAQSARGNWLGPAPEAAEVFRKGSAMIDLNNQRQSNARGFLQSRQASDLFGNFGMMEGYQPVNVITPQNQYIDAGAPIQMALGEASNRNAYTGALLSGYSANTQAQFGSYDRQWDRYLYGSFNGASGGAGAAGGGSGFNIGGAATGALSGAAAGAMVGSVVPVIGTAAGAIGGALIGGLGGGMGGGMMG